MKDYYAILGISEDATPHMIKQAYRKRALEHHPDKGGDIARFQEINEAHGVLSDPSKRAQYNEDYKAYSATHTDEAVVEISGLLMPSGESHSLKLRLSHEEFVRQFKLSPLPQGDVSELFTPLENTLERTAAAMEIPTELTSRKAIDLLINFLRGAYRGSGAELRGYVAAERARKSYRASAGYLLYEGVFDIILIDSFKQKDVLLPALQKIMDYAKRRACGPDSMSAVAHLFQNAYFRNLLSLAFHLYWQPNEAGIAARLDADDLKAFDGRREAEEALAQVREAMGSMKGVFARLLRLQLRLFSVLHHFEEDVHQEFLEAPTAKDYREKAFHILDWIPAIQGIFHHDMLLNMLLEIGTYFQRAAELEADPATKMADETMALAMYENARNCARHSTPDKELYLRARILKYISALHYRGPELALTIKHYQQRCMAIVNIFPFFEPTQSHLLFARERDDIQTLMQSLLQNYISIIENNAVSEERIPMDHKPSLVFYHAYAGVAQGWFESHDNPKYEDELRERLMHALLRENGWYDWDVMNNVDSLGIMFDRDEDGWIVPNRSLPLEAFEVEELQGISGIEVNHTTGELSFFFEKWIEGLDPPYRKSLITPWDLFTAAEINARAPFFSLDQVDPDMPLHPFNKMRFSPLAMRGTQLLLDLMIADYLLKFLTVGQEVSGKPPYKMRSLDGLMARLPFYLRDIINDYRRDSLLVLESSAQRFWFEVGVIPLADQDLGDVHRIALGQVKMELRTHKMVRDERGNLVDGNEVDEGWDLYLLSQAEMAELVSGVRCITGPAIIFIQGSNKAYFIDKDTTTLSKELIIDDFVTLISKLKRDKDAQGKLIRDPKNNRIYYEVVMALTIFTKRPHYFSAEYVFARRFSTHYNEFAQYFPEFGRLRELAKVALVVNLLNTVKENNMRKLSEITPRVSSGGWLDRPVDAQADIKRRQDKYAKLYHDCYQTRLAELETSLTNSHASHEKYRAVINAQFSEMTGKMGSMTLGAYSPEIESYCEEQRRFNQERITREDGYEVWIHNRDRIYAQIDELRAKRATELNQTRRESYISQVYKSYKSNLSDALGHSAYYGLVVRFIEGDQYPLFNALIEQFTLKLKESLIKAYPLASGAEIDAAFRGVSSTVHAINRRHVDREIEACRLQADQEIAEMTAELEAEKKEREVLKKLLKVEQAIEAQLEQLGLPMRELPFNFDGDCLWVPSSMNHHGRQFVYGGVDLRPELKIIAPDNPEHKKLLESSFDTPYTVRMGSAYIAAAKVEIAGLKTEGAKLRGSSRLIESLRQAQRAMKAAAAGTGSGVKAGARAGAEAWTRTWAGAGARPGVGSVYTASSEGRQAPAAAGAGGSGGGGRGRSGAAGGGGRRPPSPPDEGGSGRFGRGAGAGAGADAGAGSGRISPSDYYPESDDDTGAAAAGAGAARGAEKSTAAGASSRPRSLSPLSKMFGGPPTAEELAETARMRALTPRSRPASPGLFGVKSVYADVSASGGPAFPPGSMGSAKAWTMKARINAAQLPNEGRVRFVPDDDYHPSEPLLRGPSHGYIDKFKNEWTKGPSRTAGQAFEWDVQLSDLGKKQLGWLSRDGEHINVSLDGRITH